MVLCFLAVWFAVMAQSAAASEHGLSARLRFDPAEERVASFEAFVSQLFSLELDANGITVNGSVPARIVIVVAYTVAGATVEFTLSLVDEENGQILGVIEGSAAVDLQLDRLLTERLAALINSGRVAIDSIRDDQARREAALIAAERAPPPDAPEPPPPVSPAIPADSPSASADGTGATDFPRFEIAAGAAPIVPAGRASGYFGIGYSGVVRFAYRMPLGAGAFGVGLSITPIRFVRTEPELGAFFRYVVPVAIESRYSFAEGRRIEGFARIGVGASYRVPESTVAVDRLSSVLPAGVGGAGLSIRVAHRTLIAVDVGSAVIVHLYQNPDGSIGTETIVAVVPSLQLSRRF